MVEEVIFHSGFQWYKFLCVSCPIPPARHLPEVRYKATRESLHLLGNNLSEVNHALGVAPLVVVPGDNLDHVVTHDHGEGGVDGGGDIAAAVVNGHQGGLLDGEDSLHGALGGLLEGSVHLLGEGLLLDLDNEVDDGHVGGGARGGQCR